MCRVEDTEPWRVYRRSNPVARKDYRCCDCNRVIAKGERHHFATGLSGDGDYWSTFRLCAHCEAAGEWLTVVCNGWCYTTIGEELREHWDGEILLRSVGLARLIVDRERQWRRRNGELVDIPLYAKEVAEVTMERSAA